MNCPLQGKDNNTAEQERTGLPATWHRLWCPACRKARAADTVIGRGVEQMRDEAPPADSLARTLAALGMDPALASAPNRRQMRVQLGRALLLIGVGIFITTLAQPAQIGKHLFEAPHAAGGWPAGLAGFLAILGVFWYLKPLAAILLETVPIFSHRRICLIGAVSAAAVLWLVPLFSATLPGPVFVIALNALLAFASTILGGYLVEQAQQMGATGRLGALHQAAAHLGALTAPLLGFVIGRSLDMPPIVSACLLLGLGGLSYWLMPEERSQPRDRSAVSLKAHLQRIGRARDLWNVALMLFLVFGVSSFDTLLDAQQIRQHYTEDVRNHLIWIGQAATLASILLYILV